MSIKVVQSNTRRDMEDYWDWEMHLEGSREQLNEIAYVEYTLHETFPNPIRRKYDASDGFKLETAGWGEFTVHIRVHYKDSKRPDDYEALGLKLDY